MEARQGVAARHAREPVWLVAEVGRGPGAGRECNVRLGGVGTVWDSEGPRRRRSLGDADVAQVGLSDHPG